MAHLQSLRMTVVTTLMFWSSAVVEQVAMLPLRVTKPTEPVAEVVARLLRRIPPEQLAVLA
jgi:hypothetical protein